MLTERWHKNLKGIGVQTTVGCAKYGGTGLIRICHVTVFFMSQLWNSLNRIIERGRNNTYYFFDLPFFDVKHVKIAPLTSPTPRQQRPERDCSEIRNVGSPFFTAANQRMRQIESLSQRTIPLNERHNTQYHLLQTHKVYNS